MDAGPDSVWGCAQTTTTGHHGHHHHGHHHTGTGTGMGTGMGTGTGTGMGTGMGTDTTTGTGTGTGGGMMGQVKSHIPGTTVRHWQVPGGHDDVVVATACRDSAAALCAWAHQHFCML